MLFKLCFTFGRDFCFVVWNVIYVCFVFINIKFIICVSFYVLFPLCCDTPFLHFVFTFSCLACIFYNFKMKSFFFSKTKSIVFSEVLENWETS